MLVVVGVAGLALALVGLSEGGGWAWMCGVGLEVFRRRTVTVYVSGLVYVVR